MPLPFHLPPALIWTVSGLALAGAVGLPFAEPWRLPAAAPPPAVATVESPPPAPPAPGVLADALNRVLGTADGPPPVTAAPAAGGLLLEGTVFEDGASRALVRAPGQLRVRVLAVGERIGGWTLESVADGRAAFAAGPRRVELQTARGRAASAEGGTR